MKVKVAQSCPSLCNPTDYTVHGILQARILEWVAFPFSRGSSQPGDWTQVSCIAGGFFYQLSHEGHPNWAWLTSYLRNIRWSCSFWGIAPFPGIHWVSYEWKRVFFKHDMEKSCSEIHLWLSEPGFHRKSAGVRGSSNSIWWCSFRMI